MSLYALEPGEILLWEFAAGAFGEVELEARSSAPVSAYVIEAGAWDEAADPDELACVARWGARLVHRHAVRVPAHAELVAVVKNASAVVAAVDARVFRRTR